MLIFLILVFHLCGPAVAEEQYPCDQSNHDPETRREAHPEYIARRYLEGGRHAFDVPYAYFYLRPSADTINCDQFGFDLAFWMPSLAPPEKYAFTANSWPEEELYPRDGSYLIRVLPVSNIPKDVSELGLAFSILEYNLEFYKERIPSKYGLIRITPVDFWMDVYVFLDEWPRDTVIDCSSGTCAFTFFYRDLNIAVSGSFPRDKLSEWRAVKAGTKTLLKRFMVKEPQGPPLRQNPIPQ